MAKKKVTFSGEPPKTLDAAAPDMEKQEDGQHKDYWVLSDDEKTNGFVRPLYDRYRHKTCGSFTSLGLKIAETFALDNTFYTHTFCSKCRDHFPVEEFLWEGHPDKQVGK